MGKAIVPHILKSVRGVNRWIKSRVGSECWRMESTWFLVHDELTMMKDA